MGGFSQQDLADLDEISKRLPAGDPRAAKIRTAIQGQQAQPAPEKPGLLKSLGSDLAGMIPTTPAEYGRSILRVVPGANSFMDALEAPSRAQHYEEQKKAGYSLPYRAITPVAENLGVNVSGMEKSAKEGDAPGVMGHALAVPVATAITAGLAKGVPAARPIAGKALSAVSDVVPPEVTGVFSPRLGNLQRIAGKVGKAITPKASAPVEAAPETEAPLSPAAEQLQNRIQVERGLRAQPPAPRISEGLPEVEEGQGAATEHLHKAIPPNEMGNARMELTPRRVPGEIAPEAIRPRAFSASQPQPIPARPGLMLKGEVLDTRPAKIGNLLNEATGGKPLARDIPIRQQLEKVTPTTPKESSVVKSHSYDPNSREMTVTTQNGQTYVHGDVTPDQAEAFANADSKGKAWNDLRNNSTLVAKVQGGKRIPIKPSGPTSANPQDLTAVLTESVKKAKAKK